MRSLEALKNVPAPAFWLGLAGLVPFLLPLLASLFDTLLAMDRALLLQLVYGAIILSFLGGIRWGAALKHPKGPLMSTLLVLSVLPAMCAFVALVLPLVVGQILLIGAFLVQGAWDVQSAQRGELPGWFAALRALLTAGAVMALIFGLILKIMA